jgi:magnesium transporter
VKPPIQWYDLRTPEDPQLDELAERYHLHPLHIEDCRHGKQRAKIEEGPDYLFMVLKPVHVTPDGDLKISDLNLFLGRDYLITVEAGECPIVRTHLDQLHANTGHPRTDQLFYKIMDGVVDSYTESLDWFNDVIDGIEDEVLQKPSPTMLERIFASKRGLIELRRILSNTRDVSSHLQRLEVDLIHRDMAPFLRDVYDHLARDLDMVEMQRDLLTGAMDIYLSSVANRTNEVMKVLTILGTVALPVVVISGFYGMNTKGLPFIDSPYGTIIAGALMVGTTGGLLYMLKKFDWL